MTPLYAFEKMFLEARDYGTEHGRDMPFDYIAEFCFDAFAAEMEAEYSVKLTGRQKGELFNVYRYCFGRSRQEELAYNNECDGRGCEHDTTDWRDSAPIEYVTESEQ